MNNLPALLGIYIYNVTTPGKTVAIRSRFAQVYSKRFSHV